MRTHLQVLGETRIAQPCAVSWRAMKGDERVRYCNQCDRKVFDLSKLTAVDAVNLLEERGHDLCVRLYRRRDGTVMTRDCGTPRNSRWRVAAWAASLFTSLFAGGCLQGVVAKLPPSAPPTQPPSAVPQSGEPAHP